MTGDFSYGGHRWDTVTNGVANWTIGDITPPMPPVPTLGHLGITFSPYLPPGQTFILPEGIIIGAPTESAPEPEPERARGIRLRDDD